MIKRKNDGRYVASCFLTVVNPAFARRFNSTKQARSYMYKCGLKARQTDILEYDPETGERASRSEIRAACRRFYELNAAEQEGIS